MQLGKIHLNVGTEEKPKGLCGRKGKYMGYADRVWFTQYANFEEKCGFCMFKLSEKDTEEYYNQSISGQLKNKEVRSI